MMFRSLLRLAIATAVVYAAAVAPVRPASASPAVHATADFHDSIQTFNRDVYWLDGVTLRNPTADTPAEAQLYSVVGAALPVTWGEWRAASADSIVTTMGGPQDRSTQARLRLSGLVPGGIYSVFYGTFGPDSEHPGCPGVERTLPLPALGGGHDGPDHSSFVADNDGNAMYLGRVEGALLDADQLFFSIVYHFDAMTYHPFPNRGEFFSHGTGEGCRSTYGLDAMRHILVLQKL